MNGPHLLRSERLAGTQHYIESAHHMQHHGALHSFRNLHLSCKNVPLCVEVGTLQTVKATFAYLHHLRMLQESL